MLAVNVDYDSKSAVIGTAKGQPPPRAAILAALKTIGYSGEFVENASAK